MSAAIPFNKPGLVGRELAYVAEVVAMGNTAGDGPFSARCTELLEARFGVHRVLLTGSCTSALELCAHLAGVGPGDEVVVPSFTFVSTANAFVRVGARPVFADVRLDTLTLDPASVAAVLGPRTRAIVPVHYGGVACDMDALAALAADRGLLLVEDAAQALGATHRGRALGGIGDLGCWSFHETKNVHCGQGGALCVNRPHFLERAEILRDRGTDRQRFFRGEVPRYSWVDVGVAGGVLSELSAAYLYAQLEALDAVAERRARIAAWYREGLAPLETRGCVRTQAVPPACQPNHHLAYVLLEDERTRDALRSFLQAHAICAVTHYVPLHTSPFGRRLGPVPRLPVTENASRRLLRLPVFDDLGEADVERVTGTLAAFFRR